MSSLRRSACFLLGFSALTLITGCAGVAPVALSSAGASPAIQGVVHGGQQPVVGATIQLYQVGTTGDGSVAAPLGSSTTTASDGSFSLTGKYSCTNAANGGSTLVYLVATGGNPGGGTNANLAMMAALGQCGTLTSSTFIFIDEVTTVGSVAALYPYMNSYSAVGSGSSDAAQFASAFNSVSIYTNTATGAAPGPNLPSGYYASSTEINTLGNILASCINSTGGSAVGTNSSDGSACGNLFNLTRFGTVAPTNTVGAMINILNNPNQNVSALFNLPQPITPFQPVDTTAPSSWVLPIEQIAATPTFSVAGGTYSSAQFVTISSSTSGAIIHYTTDGSTPTSASPIASGAITVSSSETLNAIAQAGGYATSAVASAAYTITGSSSTYNVSGQITIPSCSVTSIPPMTVTLTHGATIVQTTTSNTSGNFSFSGVPNDTYTVTPSITGPSSVFYPTTQTAVVNGNNVNSVTFNANLGYTVSGSVAYSGTQTGQIYLALNPTSCGGGGTVGTSISSKGSFTIHGVPPGGYTLQVFMDNLGIGSPNASNPAGSTAVSVASANLTGQNVTLADPGTVTITSAPTIQGASGFNTGAVAQYKAITSNNVEQASSYTLQWSTDPAFGTITGSKTFKANGTKADAWFFNGLANTTTLPTYFRAYGTSSGTAIGPYSNIYGPVTIGAPTGGNLVTGSVTFSQTPAGAMYVGFLSQTNGNFYAEYFASPVSAQAYSIQVPSDSYNFFAILDQNNDGLIDTGDIQDATDSGNGSQAATVISAPTSNLGLTLPTVNASAAVTTAHYNSITQSGSSQSYNLNLQIRGSVKQPVAVQLTSGPNLINPIDIALCGGSGSSCGQGFQISFSIGTTAPGVGDTYTFNLTYSDGTTGTLTASVTAVLNAFATSLSPQTGTSTSVTPTFTWTDPLNASNYVYSFSLCCSTNGDIWDIPGQNSNANGFSSSTTSIVWGTDPTGGGSTPSISSLVLGTTYTWQIQVQDSNGNSAQTQVQYQP
jgi:hypothetical protein